MEITLHNRQRKVPLPLAWLRELAHAALECALREPMATADAPLPTLEEVEVTFLSDAAIAAVHRDFMDIPGATDVITFAHGEIVISAETARANALHYGRPLPEELGRYIVHGLLHLSGHEDEAQADARRMHKAQERILDDCVRSVKNKP